MYVGLLVTKLDKRKYVGTIGWSVICRYIFLDCCQCRREIFKCVWKCFPCLKWNLCFETHLLGKYLFSRKFKLIYYRHREHPLRVCRSEGHNIAAQSEGVQLGVMISQSSASLFSIIVSVRPAQTAPTLWLYRCTAYCPPPDSDSWSKRQYRNVRIEDQLTKLKLVWEKKFTAVKKRTF